MKEDKGSDSGEFWRRRYKQIQNETEQLERDFPKGGSDKKSILFFRHPVGGVTF